ncbi:MAG: serine--tRNA ligase [Candidatus Rokubacteria bacterium GWC2_70_16]|nr:MAG: serine--tRNA ligase [Candidatus Rokubacteria bacterium GWC2_70_16]
MLDVRLVREQTEMVERALAARGGTVSLREVLAADADRRALLQEAEELKAQRNRASEAIGQAKRRGETPEAELARMREVSERIRALDARVKEADARLQALALELPNLPHASVPVGVTAEDNVEVRRWGTLRRFGFEPRQHFELGEALGLLDFDRASKIAKSRFVVLWGAAARLSRALAQFMLDLHTREHGFTEVWVPHLVNAETVTGVGLLPKFEEQLFKTIEPEAGRALYLIPTAEVSVTALHGGEILAESALPKRYCAFTPCYRREAGTYGQDTKGMIRHHQFDKVELVKVTTPAQSYDELESLVRAAETVLQRLELPYRVVALCTGDMGFQSAKTYDLEVWLPGQARYREISSCSNCEAFQARRLELKYRPAGGGKVEYCHTLNGSGLAVGRTLIAVFENYQEVDGSVTIPEALRPYMGGLDRIAAGG